MPECAHSEYASGPKICQNLQGCQYARIYENIREYA